MELWTDYEGILIDDAYPLNKLVLSQGRSAFFSTVIGKDEPRLIRLIACHFDEEEILARWRGVEALGHPNFLKLERYGQLQLDDATVIYAIFERVDLSLADVLKERPLSPSETRELASSVASALEMLHMHGFVHEHLSPENVLAVGEMIKLRTDCIRETPEGELGIEAKRRDVRDLALVLAQALTQAWAPDAVADAARLPAPFDQVVQNGMNGSWGIGEITAALRGGGPQLRSVVANGAAPLPFAEPEPAVAEARPEPVAEVPQPTAQAARAASFTDRPPLRIEQALQQAKQHSQWIGAAAIAALVLLVGTWAAWHSWHSRPASSAGLNQHPIAASATSAAKVSQPSAAPAPARATAVAANHGQWRVIAYTYRHRDQAEKKAASVAQKHPELRPEVFAPAHRAPYLVAIGGAMDKEQAFALAKAAQGAGLPRDTYAQNYGR